MSKALLIIISFLFCTQAAMVGDFSPMQVGNRWVYHESGNMFSIGEDRIIIEITGTQTKGDSTFYTIMRTDSASSSVSVIMQKYLEFNGKNYLYDSVQKSYADLLLEPLDFNSSSVPFFKFNQLPDSILKRAVYLNQNLSLCDSTFSLGFDPSYSNVIWLQNYGLVWDGSGMEYHGSVGYDSLILLSFNGQPFDLNAVTGTKSYNVPSTKHISFKFNKDQFRFDNVSPTDRLNVRMYDFLGRLLFSRQQAQGNDIFSITRFPHAPYIIMFQKNQENWERSLIINQ